MADALRPDGQAWKPLKPEDAATQELRQLCRDEVTLIEQRTARVCRIRQALHEYDPTALEAFGDWTRPAAKGSARGSSARSAPTPTCIKATRLPMDRG
jgi:transposase